MTNRIEAAAVALAVNYLFFVASTPGVPAPRAIEIFWLIESGIVGVGAACLVADLRWRVEHYGRFTIPLSWTKIRQEWSESVADGGIFEYRNYALVALATNLLTVMALRSSWELSAGAFLVGGLFGLGAVIVLTRARSSTR